MKTNEHGALEGRQEIYGLAGKKVSSLVSRTNERMGGVSEWICKRFVVGIGLVYCLL